MKTRTTKIITILMIMVMLTSVLVGATKCKKPNETEPTDTSGNETTIWINPNVTGTDETTDGTSTSGTTETSTSGTTTTETSTSGTTTTGTSASETTTVETTVETTAATTTTPTTTATTVKPTEPAPTTAKPTEPTATTAKPTPTPKPTPVPTPTTTPTGHVCTLAPNYKNIWIQPLAADGTTNDYASPIYSDVPVYEIHVFGLVNGLRADLTILWREGGKQEWIDAGYWDVTGERTENTNFSDWRYWKYNVSQTTNEDVQVGVTSSIVGYNQLAQYQVKAIGSYGCTTCDRYVTLTEYINIGYTMPSGYKTYSSATSGGTVWIPV